jgi:hypothetical protein
MPPETTPDPLPNPSLTNTVPLLQILQTLEEQLGDVLPGIRSQTNAIRIGLLELACPQDTQINQLKDLMSLMPEFALVTLAAREIIQKLKVLKAASIFPFPSLSKEVEHELICDIDEWCAECERFMTAIGLSILTIDEAEDFKTCLLAFLRLILALPFLQGANTRKYIQSNLGRLESVQPQAGDLNARAEILAAMHTNIEPPPGLQPETMA